MEVFEIENFELFNRYPFLVNKLPRLPLGNWPTPLKKLEGVSAELGESAFIKRDDLSHSLYGGNKVRKMELVFEDVKRRKRKTIITIGGLGSHHILATAALGREMGFKTVGLFFCQPVNDHVRANLLLNNSFGAEMHFVKDYPGVAKEFLKQFFSHYRKERRPPYLLVPGGSTALSTIGYINAVMELEKQLKEEGLPHPKAIFVPAGSGGTVAGLLAGLALTGMATVLYGVQVVPHPVLTVSRVEGLARRALKNLASLGVTLNGAEKNLTKNRFHLLKNYLGSGYGFNTKEGTEAMETFEELDGIKLEGCYTGKAAAAFIYYCRNNTAPRELPVIFFNTYSSTHDYPDKKSFPQKAKELPEEFRWCFGEKPSNCDCGLKRTNRLYCETGEYFSRNSAGIQQEK